MADPLSISVAGAAVVANASKAESLLINVAQTIGNAPENVRLALGQVQTAKAVVVGLNTLLQSPGALPDHERPKYWLKEVKRAVDAASVELSILYMRLEEYDQWRKANKLQSIWTAVRGMSPNDELVKFNGRMQLANSALSLLIFCPQESSATPDREMYLDQARSAIESLLLKRAADMVPPTGPKTPNSVGRQGTKSELDLSPYHHPPGSLFGDIHLHAMRSSQQLAETISTRSEETPSQAGDAVALKQDAVAKDKRIAELEAELAKLRDDSNSHDGGTKDELFHSVVSKYKNVKRLYFEAKKEVDDLTKEVEELKMSDKTSIGKDKVIEAWKEQYDQLSKQLRSQDESNDIMKMWREKYEALLAQHDGLRETTARSIEELRKENSSLIVGRLTISNELEATQLELSKVLVNNEDLSAQVSRLTVEVEQVKWESKRTMDSARRLRTLWQETGTVLDGLAPDLPCGNGINSNENT